MSEFVVYEDTPFAEYLSSIESQESTVRLPTLQLDSNPLDLDASSTWIPQSLQMPRWTNTLYHYWRRSLFHDTFSISLPIAEENEFEEKFKYLIATSPLLSEVLSVHNASKSNKQRTTQHVTTTTDYSTMATKASRAGVVGTVTTMTGCMMALGIEAFKLRHQMRQQSQPAKLFLGTPVVSMTMMLTSSMSLFFGYRHMRRSGIRHLYRTALNTLQTLMEQCEMLDNKVHRALITIQEIELVSRGYRLSLPLSPISRIEQSSRSRRCVVLRNRLGAVLRRAFIIYEEAIIDLIDHVNKSNLSRLYDMYNIRSIASLSALDRMDDDNSEEGGICLDRLRALAQLMHAKRRECMMQLLALDIVTDEHDSLRLDYERGWRGVNAVLAKVTEDTKQFVNDITHALENELYKPTAKDDRQQLVNSNTVQDGRLRPFVHRLASLDQQMRTVEAKFYLCNDDIRQLTQQGDSTSLEELRERLKREYLSIEQDFNQMVVEWEAGRDALVNFLDPPDLDPSPSSSISSPTASQKEDDSSPVTSPSTNPQKVVDSEDNGLLELPLPARASVFEAVAETIERNTIERPKKSRAQRIAEMKAKREQEARDKASKMDPKTMVHELKDVLDRRVNEFGLEPETKPEPPADM
ncbi:hypothetical protein RO3G_12984 [Lichtheimia corymbifera JMRC:FSU:9682]|uniref:Vezatin n=1 Tax=Lichtheimia corymbifera JMRC:FSU:9682 TaxID=1263082 RepID=A0A068SES6_9FUNG|nr:hypothetical protein RO3G_12984 [Lichtheimia corymbifera JMRC:FSU:9682]